MANCSHFRSFCMENTFMFKIPIFCIIPNRGRRYDDEGNLITKKKGRNRLPLNWRTLNYNPARIPSAWIPKDYYLKQKIDYEYEKEVAKYIPGYQMKIPDQFKEDFKAEALYTVDSTTKFAERLRQALFLTKSIIAGKGLPTKIMDCASTAALSHQDKDVIQIFQHAHLFDVDPDITPKENYLNRWQFYKLDNFVIFPPPERYVPSIMQELIRLCQVRSAQVHRNLHKRLLVSNIVSTSCFDRVCSSLKETFIPNFENHWKMRFKSGANSQVQADSTLPPYADAQTVANTENISLASIYPSMPVIDVKTTNNYELCTHTGVADNTAFPYVRIMAIFDTELLKPSQLYAKMLSNLFASLYATAVKLYGSIPQDLPQPLTAHCVGSNGQKFQFLCLQLNTTKLGCDEGIKNMVWVDIETASEEMQNSEETMSPLTMYSSCSHTTWKSPDYYLDYNPEVFKIFQGFWLTATA